MRKILIIGATSSIAQACMYYWAQKGNISTFICIARNKDKLKSITDDLSVRFTDINIQSYIIDFNNIKEISVCLEQCFKNQMIDEALIVQGMMYKSENTLDADQINELLHVNTISLAVSLNVIYEKMRLQQHGTIGVIGSVAGDRGRKANYLYGASKSFVATYVEGLQHKAALNRENINISLIKPGPTASAMTQYLIASGKKLANIHEVAQEIAMGMQKGKRVIYTPKIWRIIMLVIRHIPFFVFKKMDI